MHILFCRQNQEEEKEMDALEAILTRRSTRNYKPDAVEAEKLDQILKAAGQAPSGGNNQHNHFLVIRNRDVIQKLIVMTEAAFAEMEIQENTYASLKHAISASKRGGYIFCYNAPVLIAVANRLDYGNNMADCACAIENMMIAANALGLGSCWINQLKWLNGEPELTGYLRSLGMKEDERIYGAVILGYPATESGLPNRNLMQQKGNEVTFID
jgi:nitroreductase